MNIAPTLVRDKLKSAILEVSNVGWLYSKNPKADYTRNRKLPMAVMLNLLLKFSGKGLQEELCELHQTFKLPEKVPTKAAFVMQRKKLLPDACYVLFRSFTDSLPFMRLFDGYRLLACDGSSVPIPRNENEPDYSVVTREDRKSYNQLHINGLFDILNRIFVDCILEPGMHTHERAALTAMVHRFPHPEKAIFLADRGYEGYNGLAHLLEDFANFVIRAKDLDSNGFLRALHLPAVGDLDIDISKTLVFNIPKAHRGDDRYVKVYRGHFDPLDSGSADSYAINFRLVRFQLSDGSYECLITNLPRDKFPPKRLAKLYHLRWGIENAFRDLKYPLDLLHFHGKSAQAVLQEVFCALSMFNFCAYICVHSDVLRVSKDTKYRYKINFANAVGPCRSYLHGRIGEAELLDRLRLSPTPIRPDRQAPRGRIKEQSSREFNYRAS